MRKVLEYNLTSTDGTLEAANQLIKDTIETAKNNFEVDELVVKVNDVYSTVKLKGKHNVIGSNNVIQINK